MSTRGAPTVRGPVTAEEAAAVIAAVLTRGAGPVATDPYAEWRRRRIEAVRRST